MASLYTTLQLFLVFFAAAVAAEVTPLSASTFMKAIAAADVSLVEFYAPWCGHCKALEPEYKKVSKNFERNRRVGVFKVDAVEQQALAQKFGVQSFPTIKLFFGTVEQEKYEGERSAEALVAYIQAAARRAPSSQHPDDGDGGGGDGDNGGTEETESTLTKAQEETWRAQLGRSTWFYLHSVAAKYPKHPTEADRKAVEGVVNALQLLYPCALCKQHLQAHLRAMPAVDSTSRVTVSKWFCALHNRVNADLGKQPFSCDIKVLDKKYNKNCPGCVTDGAVEDLKSARELKEENVLKQDGDCSLSMSPRQKWLVVTPGEEPELTDGALTIVFFYAVTCHVCHDIHPLLKQLVADFGHRGLNVIAVHSNIYGDSEQKWEQQAKDYHALEELPYPSLQMQHTARVGESDRVPEAGGLYRHVMGERFSRQFGAPAMAVLKDCEPVWRGMGYQLKRIREWVTENADKLLAKEPASKRAHISYEL